VLALVTPSDELVAWTGIFLLFNVLALTCILAVYLPAVLKANKTVPQDASSAGGSKSGQFLLGFFLEICLTVFQKTRLIVCDGSLFSSKNDQITTERCARFVVLCEYCVSIV